MFAGTCLCLDACYLSEMRIIAGSAKRREIKVPNAVVRPTTDRTREALFSILQSYVGRAKVLDLFAGAGSLGMEALSRGAQSCDFIEANRICAKVINENLAGLGLRTGSVIKSDAMSFVRHCHGKYDLVFAAPPYFKTPGDRDFVTELLQDKKLPTILENDGIVVMEVDANHHPVVPSPWEQLDRRRYGSCVIIFIRKNNEAS